MNLCARHRRVIIAAPRKNSKEQISRFIAGNPDACPYCLLWSTPAERKKRK